MDPDDDVVHYAFAFYCLMCRPFITPRRTLEEIRSKSQDLTAVIVTRNPPKAGRRICQTDLTPEGLVVGTNQKSNETRCPGVASCIRADKVWYLNASIVHAEGNFDTYEAVGL